MARTASDLSRFYLLVFFLSMATLAAEHVECTRPAPQPAWPRKRGPCHPRAAPLQEISEQIRAGSEASFERAVFYKPLEDSLTGLEMTFAPLIVQEIETTSDRLPATPRRDVQGEGTEIAGDVGPIDPSPFGAVVGEGGRPRVDPSRPTVYAGTFTVRIHGAELDQIVYFWRYPHRSDEPGIASLEGRGVRITLGVDGLPLLWEALSTATDTRIIFVSESLEAAAKREFGVPLTGRQYLVERSLEETPNVIVARVLDDGPVPMGPYVYLNAPPERAVTTVLCRCMSSQVNEFVETAYYNLVPLESIKEWGDTRSCVDPPPPRVHWRGTLSYWNLRIPWEDKPLEHILRWPKLEGR